MAPPLLASCPAPLLPLLLQHASSRAAPPLVLLLLQPPLSLQTALRVALLLVPRALPLLLVLVLVLVLLVLLVLPPPPEPPPCRTGRLYAIGEGVKGVGCSVPLPLWADNRVRTRSKG